MSGRSEYRTTLCACVENKQPCTIDGHSERAKREFCMRLHFAISLLSQFHLDSRQTVPCFHCKNLDCDGHSLFVRLGRVGDDVISPVRDLLRASERRVAPFEPHGARRQDERLELLRPDQRTHRRTCKTLVLSRSGRYGTIWCVSAHNLWF